jgi:glucose/arabinose dehydrogenase
MVFLKSKWFVLLSWLILALLFSSAYAGDGLRLKQVFSNIAFKDPLAILQAPGQTNVWYVVEKAGRVLRINGLGKNSKSSVFADIRDRVESEANETGLLGMAFDPHFSANGRVYFSYTWTDISLESVLSRFRSYDGGKTVQTKKEEILLRVLQPYPNHNGGDIQFGPDGYLYYGLGDGGLAGDPEENGQNTQSLLGALLRIDVSGEYVIKGYRIPKDNPFVKGGGRSEIYAYGFRNPWRWSFDRKTGDLWLADVGQDSWEEVDRVVVGGNYGWNIKEGKHCYSGDCKKPGLIDPVVEYSHAEGCSITGGYVYRGTAIPSLRGTYLFGDYCSGTIWGINTEKLSDMKKRVLFKTDMHIASFGEDNVGEIYVVDLKGRIFKIVKE